ncbi:hypothetical protein [Polynucleobacter sp. MWH-UH35A]|uniref:hypothetical protein n=1 Tax=Polynucleobacter sp. MWH-UH35A TaxID=1855619 RepID=UPI001BFD2F51|nr:hypothetical protein [Polynucleobacter sp. MWH-UH35A]QWD60453.1 hypothetical protein ICV36_01805 [Polynucleobacter sp. MWH-UH35A]
MNSDCAVVVLSCDKYSDVWPFTLASLERYYDNFNKIYFVSNEIEVIQDNITNIKVGADLNWSSSLIKALNMISEKYLLILLEDMIIDSNVNNETLLYGYSLIESNSFQHLQFSNFKKPNVRYLNEKLGVYDVGAPYSVNVMGYWNKDILSKLLIEGESPWNFEVFGSYRMQYFGKSGSIIPSPFNYLHLIEKGRWIPGICRILNIKYPDISTKNRRDSTGGYKFLSQIKSFLFNSISNIPWKYRLYFTNIFRKLFGTY